MSSVLNFKDTNPEQIREEKTIFIWLDILGFADAVEDENKYRDLAELLKKFQSLFDNGHEYDTEIISDGLILQLKSNKANSIKTAFFDIQQKQFEFIKNTNYFIRGGIAVGTKLNTKNEVNSRFVSNGLARAVKLESKFINWPIIGSDLTNIQEIKKLISAPEEEDFGLIKCFNVVGQNVYFMDFIEKDETYYQILTDKIRKHENEPGIRAKYIWLLRYYHHKFDNNLLHNTLKGIVL
jgi:hypothetical protein